MVILSLLFILFSKNWRKVINAYHILALATKKNPKWNLNFKNKLKYAIKLIRTNFFDHVFYFFP